MEQQRSAYLNIIYNQVLQLSAYVPNLCPKSSLINRLINDRLLDA